MVSAAILADAPTFADMPTDVMRLHTVVWHRGRGRRIVRGRRRRTARSATFLLRNAIASFWAPAAGSAVHRASSLAFASIALSVAAFARRPAGRSKIAGALRWRRGHSNTIVIAVIVMLAGHFQHLCDNIIIDIRNSPLPDDLPTMTRASAQPLTIRLCAARPLTICTLQQGF